MKNPLIFASTCPACARQKLQYGYTRRALIKLIESLETIDAYCLECDVVWAVTPEERAVLVCAIAARQRSGADCATGLLGPTQQQPQATAHR